MIVDCAGDWIDSTVSNNWIVTTDASKVQGSPISNILANDTTVWDSGVSFTEWTVIFDMGEPMTLCGFRYKLESGLAAPKQIRLEMGITTKGPWIPIKDVTWLSNDKADGDWWVMDRFNADSTIWMWRIMSTFGESKIPQGPKVQMVQFRGERE